MVYRGVDDGLGNLRRAVRDADGTRLNAEILERLAPMLCPSPAALRGAIAQLFYDPLRFRSVADVAQAAGITRRSLDRTLCSLALEPARTFLLAARVSWAYRRIRATNVRVGDVSRQLGVSKPERFAKQTRSLLGLTPSAIRTHIAPDQFVERIVMRLRRQPRSSPAFASYESPGHGLESTRADDRRNAHLPGPMSARR
jgi:AraC-like DNA-binding protein